MTGFIDRLILSLVYKKYEVIVNKFLLISMLSYLFVSCAGFRSQKVAVVGELPGEIRKSNKQLRVSITLKDITHVHNTEESRKLAKNSQMLKLQTLIEDVYRESKHFKLVKKTDKNRDLDIDVELKRDGETNMLMALTTAITLYLVPSKTTDNYVLTTKFIKAGEQIGVISKSETITTWQQIFLILAMPFKYPISVENEMLKDLTRSTIIEAYNENYFTELDH
jgi:hypothetical protein